MEGYPERVQGLRRTGPEKKGGVRGGAKRGEWGVAEGGPWLRGRGGQEGAGRDQRGVVMRGVAFLGG